MAAIEEQFSRLHAADELLRLAQRRARVLRRLLFRAATCGAVQTTALAKVAEIVSGQTPKGLEPLAEGPVPFFKVGDMNTASGYEMKTARAYLDDALITRFKLKVRPAGTVIFPKRGGAIATNKKRILLQPAAFDLNTMGLIASDALVPRFLLYWLETKDLASLADGSNVPQINVPDVAPSKSLFRRSMSSTDSLNSSKLNSQFWKSLNRQSIVLGSEVPRSAGRSSSRRSAASLSRRTRPTNQPLRSSTGSRRNRWQQGHMGVVEERPRSEAFAPAALSTSA